MDIGRLNRKITLDENLLSEWESLVFMDIVRLNGHWPSEQKDYLGRESFIGMGIVSFYGHCSSQWTLAVVHYRAKVVLLSLSAVLRGLTGVRMGVFM